MYAGLSAQSYSFIGHTPSNLSFCCLPPSRKPRNVPGKGGYFFRTRGMLLPDKGRASSGYEARDGCTLSADPVRGGGRQAGVVADTFMA